MFQTNRAGEALFAVSRAPAKAWTRERERESPVTLHQQQPRSRSSSLCSPEACTYICIHTYLPAYLHAISLSLDTSTTRTIVYARARAASMYARSCIKASVEHRKEINATEWSAVERYGMHRESARVTQFHRAITRFSRYAYDPLHCGIPFKSSAWRRGCIFRYSPLMVDSIC